MATSTSPFSPDLFLFLQELIDNNNRQWFETNKERYITDVREPMSQFIVMMQESLHRISKHIHVDPRPTGGSMFRIYRDTRFSKDKTPYKTQAACHFRHGNRTDAHGLGFYMHVGPNGNTVGGGVWRPPTAVANMIRTRIAEHPDQWRQTIGGKAFNEYFPDGIQGEQLKRVPRDFDPDHPLADTLRRKDFFLGSKLTDEQVISSGLIKRVSEIYTAMAPMMAFIAAALGLKW
jgi:uncharacterized protein (TIGR02453 family)